MKKITATVIIVISWHLSQAQGIGSFFNQKQTQKKYYLQQIAALRLQLGYVKTGYDIAGKGLKNIHGFKDNEYSLHQTYYQSLRQVNAAIQHSNAVKEIYRLAAAIRTTFLETIEQVEAKKVMPEKEMKYIRSVYKNLEQKLNEDLEELTMVTTPGRLSLTDDERWTRVKAVQAEVEDKYAFTQSFTRKALFVAEQKRRELEDMKRMKKVHNIKD